jgi:N-formylglutamate deformylase
MFGVAIVVDCHSMPSAAASPDVVIGDRLGLSALAAVTSAAERAFSDAGFSVARNAPYAGGHTIHVYGRPADGIHALQIEINRGLYLQEERVERTPQFAQVRRAVGDALRRVVSLDLSGASPAAARMAAE